MRTYTRRFIAAFLICLGVISSSVVAYAEVDFEAQQRILAVIEGYKADIAQRAGTLGEAIGKAREAGSTDPGLWQEVDKRRSEYIQAAQQTLPLIDQQVKALLVVNPVALVPTVYFSSPFASLLSEAEAEQKEASAFAAKFLHAYQFCQDELLKARMDNIEAIRESLSKFILQNTEVAVGTKATANLSKWLGPVGKLVGLLSSLVDLADDADVINTIVLRRKTWEKNSKEAWDEYQTMKPVLQHFEALVKSIRIWDQESLKLEDDAKKYGGIWLKDLDNAVEKKKQEDEANYQKDKNKQQPTIQLGGGGGGYIPVIPPVTPADYMGEVNSILSGLESEYKGARDGGDPKTFEEAGERTFEKTRLDLIKAAEAVTRASEAFTAAQVKYWQDCQPINQRYAEIMARGNWCGACSGIPDVIRLNAQVIAEAEAYIRPALAAAAAPVYAAGAALVEPIRQRSKAEMVQRLVMEGYYKLWSRLYYDGQLIAGQFRALWQEVEGTLQQETGKMYSMVYTLPSVYTIDLYRSFADNMDGWVQGQLEGGVSPVSIQRNLLDTALTVRALDENIKQAVPPFELAEQNALKAAQLGKDQLFSFITKYGKLITPHLYYYYPISGGDQVELLRAHVAKTFTVYEWEGPKALKQANLSQLAARIEAKSGELDEASGWIDLYNGRLSVAAYRLNKISLAVIDKELYDLIYLNPRQQLVDLEFKKPEWQGLLATIDSAVPEKDRAGMPWTAATPWAARLPRERLDTGLQVYYMQLQEVFKNYLQSRQYGGFVLINRDQYDAASKHWDEVLAATKTYNEKVAPIVAETTALRENVAKFKEPVTAVYEKMPGYLKKIVNANHQRFLKVSDLLALFLQSKESAISILTPDTSSYMSTIAEWLTSYKKAKDDWDEMERRNAEMFKEMERKRKIEEQQRLADELKKAEEQKKQTEGNLAVVKDLYSGFRSAYEGRDDSQVMSFISDEWQAGDGSTLSDLQMNLRRSFKTFDDIKYNIQNLSITPGEAGRYMVSYEVTITSRIYKRNLKHEEKSSINEEVVIDSSGKAKIIKTLGGRFWYVE